jgi:hypothetical protein
MPQVVHALVETWKVGKPIREAGATLVEHHHPGVSREAQQPTTHIRFIPPMLNMS